MKSPEFPDFKPIDIEDRDFLHRIIRNYQPQTSELTFTNLFIWRKHYGLRWSVYGDWVFFSCNTMDGEAFVLQPLGPSPRGEATAVLLEWLAGTVGGKQASMERVDSRLVSELEGSVGFLVEPTREHFDYVYRSEDLVKLPGNKYHGKRNHIAALKKSFPFNYIDVTGEHIAQCLELAQLWCSLRRCEEDMNLTDEGAAIKEALDNFDKLKIKGGAIIIDGRLEAFSLGELLNTDTAVIHIEKANPDIRGLYPLINQQFCENAWSEVLWINREQDLGLPGLRKAKQSYCPYFYAEKSRLVFNNSS